MEKKLRMIGELPRNWDRRNVLPVSSLAVKSGALLPTDGAARALETSSTAAASDGSTRKARCTGYPPYCENSVTSHSTRAAATLSPTAARRCQGLEGNRKS